MSCDKLVYDLAQEVEGSPNVFIRKDWLNILDNQNQNYQNNQSIIDTSQLANSNKYMAYREAYLAIPLLLTMKGTVAGGVFQQTGESIGDFSIGLKNWFGQIIHSFTLDYNGTTIIQQTPFCNMWNTFKLLTTLSYNDIITQGCTIGFYPDTSDSWMWMDAYNTANAVATNNIGLNVCNNALTTFTQPNNTQIYTDNTYNRPSGNYYGGNEGLSRRIEWIAYNPNGGLTSGSSGANSCDRPYGAWTPSLQTGTAVPANNPFVGRPSTYAQQIWNNVISFKTIPTTPGANSSYANGSDIIMQISVMATVYLKHIHSFFNMCPLLKGVFMKMTMNLNNATSTVGFTALNGINSYSSNVFVGGVNPIMIPSLKTGLNWLTTNVDNGANTLKANAPTTLQYNISVGAICTDNTLLLTGANTGALSKSVYLYIPAYTFNPTFEQAYLSNSVKQIKYTDIYQYQVKAIQSGQPFNNLITNGIANIKSVLIIPFYSKGYRNNSAGAVLEVYSQYQSPFDPAGCGCTAPMTTLGNFNIQISGQNAIYNMQRYTFEEWNNQLYGQNAVNGGLTDGLTSGLISYHDFLHSYGYYYVNVERMLPVEQSVPKSVQILGQNYSSQEIDLWVFVEYGVQIAIDVLTGARV